jgi:hypothetical protein
MCGVWRGYDVAGVGGGEFALRLVSPQRVAPLYWRSDTHTHTPVDGVARGAPVVPFQLLLRRVPPVDVHRQLEGPCVNGVCVRVCVRDMHQVRRREGDGVEGRGRGPMLCGGGVATAWTDTAGASSDGVVGGESDGNDGDGIGGTGGNDDPSVWSLLGDLAGLLSAVGYGAYTVLLRQVCPKDEDRMSMQLLFGYVGLLNMIIRNGFMPHIMGYKFITYLCP